MKNQSPIRPLPAAFLADCKGAEQGILENRIKRGFPTYFRTRSGTLICISWSERFKEFKISNSVTVATAFTAQAAFRFVAQINEMPEIGEESKYATTCWCGCHKLEAVA